MGRVSFPAAIFRLAVLLFWLDHAAAARILAPQGGIDYRRGAAHARFHTKGLSRAVLGASSALHTGIAVFDPDPTVFRAQDRMWTYHKAHTAPNAFLLIEL